MLRSHPLSAYHVRPARWPLRLALDERLRAIAAELHRDGGHADVEKLTGARGIAALRKCSPGYSQGNERPPTRTLTARVSSANSNSLTA